MNEKLVFFFFFFFFKDFVGDSPRMRILQHLIEGRKFDYTLTDMLNAGVRWGTLHTEFPKLLKHGIAIKVREIGRAKLYKINSKNPIAKKLMAFYDDLIRQEINKLKIRQKIIVRT